MKRERLPGNIFNDYNVGGYLTWAMPEYPDYIDGRGRPFGDAQFYRAVFELPQQLPDSSAWQQEAGARGINTVIVSLDGIVFRYINLRAFCDSQTWRPVYLDEVSAIFVRRSPETQPLIDRLQIDCDRVAFSPPNTTARGALLNFWNDSALVLTNLGRTREALEAVERGLAIFSENRNLRMLRAHLLVENGQLQAAELELRRVIQSQPVEPAYSALAELLLMERRYPEAAEALRQAGDLSPHPHQIYFGLGRLYLDLGQPRLALSALDDSIRFDAYTGSAQLLGAEFHAQVAETRARAYWALGDRRRALEQQEAAVRFTPQDWNRRRQLMQLYEVQGLRPKPQPQP